MHIGLIFAMQEELDAFLQLTTHKEKHTIKHLTIHEVSLSGHRVFCILSGIGKVNASYATTMLIEHFDIKLLLNSGVAGGLNTHIGTLVLAEGAVYHDVDVTPFSYDYGQVPNFDPIFPCDSQLLTHAKAICDDQGYLYKTGLIASGDQFVTDIKPLENIRKMHKNIYAIEMESTAIAHVATIAKIPVFIIRAISDTIGLDDQAENFNVFLQKSSKKAATLMKALIERYDH